MKDGKMAGIPERARAVVIGGGVSGCSVAYHLAKAGWEVVLLERKRLTSGTTWHAAGLIGQLRANQNMTRLAKYSAELYYRLEAETGVATGMKRVGSMTVALTPDRMEEIARQATIATIFGVEVHRIGPSEIKALYPHLNIDGVVGGVHLPNDGQCDPANIAMALAKGARMAGAKIFENVKVTRVTEAATANGGRRVTGVAYEGAEGPGTIAADVVVNCGGMWGRDLAAQNGVTVPLHAAEHFYLVTEPIAGLGDMPVLRLVDECAYYKSDAGKMMLGAFEPKAKPWGMGGIREDFEFDTLPEDWDHFMPILEMAMHRMPMFQTAGIHTFFNGPESFTPDDRYYLGPAPELGGYWVAAGYNSIGIISSGGAGMALAQWITEGEPPFDLWDVDIRRAQPFQKNRRYLKERVSETLGLLYADHYPYRQVVTSRGVRRSPLHDHLKAAGAVFGEVAGWERANWFARPGQEREYRYSWGRQNWFDNQRDEHMAVRTGVGLFDMTSFGKIRVEGRDACRFLNRVCSAQMDVAEGRVVYTMFLNPRGGIEADLTVARMADDLFYIVTGTGFRTHDFGWIADHLPADGVSFRDVTEDWGTLSLMGPEARDILARVTPADVSGAALPFGSAHEITIAGAPVRALRVTYVGELGWELHTPLDRTGAVFDALMEAGANLRPVGYRALESLRLEKGYRAWSSDITPNDTPFEAGLGWAVKMKGNTPFLGRAALEAVAGRPLTKRFAGFTVDDPAAVLLGRETILRDGQPVGYLTSGGYGHTVGKSIGFGYVRHAEGVSDDWLAAGRYDLVIAGTTTPAQLAMRPLYDPEGLRIRA